MVESKIIVHEIKTRDFGEAFGIGLAGKGKFQSACGVDSPWLTSLYKLFGSALGLSDLMKDLAFSNSKRRKKENGVKKSVSL